MLCPGGGRKCRFTFGISPTKCEIMIFGPRFHVPSCAVTLAGTLSLVVDGVVLTHFSLGSVMYGISFHVESPVSFDVARIVSQCTAQPFDLMCFPASQGGSSCASIRLLPFADGRCSAQVWSPSSRLAFGLTKRCGFPQTCLARRPSPLRRAAIVPLLGALSPCPTVNAPIFHAALSIPSS